MSVIETFLREVDSLWAPRPKVRLHVIGSARLGPTSLSEIDLRQYHVDGVTLFGVESSLEGLVVDEGHLLSLLRLTVVAGRCSSL